jgi:hypothetical protein
LLQTCTITWLVYIIKSLIRTCFSGINLLYSIAFSLPILLLYKHIASSLPTISLILSYRLKYA